jgi:hypothetical protein
MVSEYVNTGNGWLMVVGFVGWALSLGATSLLARFAIFGGRGLALLLLLAGAGIVVVSLFATQTSAGILAPGVERSIGGRLHDLGSAIATLALLGAVIAASGKPHTPRWLSITSGGILTLVMLSVVVLLASGDHYPGIRQRVLLASGCTWHTLLLCALGSRRSGCAHRLFAGHSATNRD